jgi:hypothetical protein
MTCRIRGTRPIFIASFAALFLLPLAPAIGQAAAPGILGATQAGKLVPASVYFDGQTATTQLRNSAGVRFADGQLALAVLVDSSGYSGSVAQKYQGYLLTGVPLDFRGHRLPAGEYGMGVVHGELYVMDLGNHDLFRAAAVHDGTMHRPVPLQILAGTAPGTYRLCLGRECVQFRRAE